MKKVATSLCKTTFFYNIISIKMQIFLHYRLGELLIAKYNNGENYYRAVCISLSEIDCKVSFIDYGSEQIVAFSDVWKYPKQLLVPCVSRSLALKLASGKALKKNVNLSETMESFVNANNFEGVIENLGKNKYAVTIDDSLIIFK